jgi:hypothetical protein
VLNRQVLCHLSHFTSPFCFSDFLDRGLFFFPWVAGIIDTYTIPGLFVEVEFC